MLDPLASEPKRRLLGDAITDLLAIEHACIWAEIEAKLGEPEPDVDGFRPHVLAIARDELLADGLIEATVPTKTRGAHEFVAYHLRDAAGMGRRIADAAARKRLLHARYTGWGQTSARHRRGLIGPAGERVVRTALRDSALAATYLAAPIGEVANLLGAPVPGGPFDDAALHMGVRGGTADAAIWLLVEVKNVRHWLYPRHSRVYQLLDKAARLAIAHPGTAFLPVLVCRRRH